MDVLDSSFLSQCSDFQQSFTSISQMNNVNTSSYLQSSSTPANNPIVQMDNMNLFSTPNLKHEPDTGTPNSHFPQDFTHATSAASTPSAPNDLSLTKGHSCEVCGKVFADRNLLSKHKIAHSEAKHICNTCGRPFVREDKLRRHIRCVHSNERPYVCEVCSKAFARKDKLQEHAKHHNKDITFPCTHCTEIFLMRSLLNRHLRNTHQTRPTSDSYKVAPLKNAQGENIPHTPGAQVGGSKKKRQRTSDSQFQAAPPTDIHNNSNTTAAAAAAAAQYYQSAGGWNAANLLLYNRYHQQQQQCQQQQQLQQQQFDWSGAAAVASAGTNYGFYSTSQASTGAGYQFPAQQYANAMRHHQASVAAAAIPNPAVGATANYPGATQTAFNAAMAARLFSPANYWWPQASQNFVFQQPAATAYNFNPAIAAVAPPPSAALASADSPPRSVSGGLPTPPQVASTTDIPALVKHEPSSPATTDGYAASRGSNGRHAFAPPPVRGGTSATALPVVTTDVSTYVSNVGASGGVYQVPYLRQVQAVATATTDAQSPTSSSVIPDAESSVAPIYSSN